MDNKKDRINIYVSKELKERIYKKAEELGISASSYIVVAINDYMKQESVVEMADMFKELKKMQLGAGS